MSFDAGMKGIFSEAMDEVREALGQEVDRDLLFYSNLKPADFETIKERWGEDFLHTYIRNMEAKRRAP